jgi:TRAP-type C4-dicarboxylate transport system permease small subunit
MSKINPISQAISPAARLATLACGWGVLLYAVALSLEVLGRKLFNTSFKGIDELGGFVLAIAAAIGASYAMAQRSHTRVDVFLVRFSRATQRILNTLGMTLFAFFACFAAWRGFIVLRETLEFKSSAPNLEVPLWIPQAAWVLGLALLALISTVYALHAVYLLIYQRPELNAWYGPSGAQEELEAELAQIKARGTAEAAGLKESKHD